MEKLHHQTHQQSFAVRCMIIALLTGVLAFAGISLSGCNSNKENTSSDPATEATQQAAPKDGEKESDAESGDSNKTADAEKDSKVETKDGIPVPKALDYPHFLRGDVPLVVDVKVPEGLVALSSKEGSYGYMDQDFNWVVEPQFQYAENPLYGYAIAQKEQFGEFINYVVDMKGNDVLGEPLPPELYNAPNLLTLQKDDPKTQLKKFKEFKKQHPEVSEVFYAGENLFTVFMPTEPAGDQLQYDVSGNPGERALIDADFNFIIDFDDNMLDLIFSDGLAAYNGYVMDQGTVKYINPTGKTVFEVEGTFPGYFYQGVAPLTVSKDTGAEFPEYLTGLIDKHGAWVKEPTFFMLEDFRLGEAAATVQEASSDEWRVGVIDTKGNWTVEPTSDYYQLHKLADNRYLAFGSEDVSLIDKTGTKIASLPFGYVSVIDGKEPRFIIRDFGTADNGAAVFDTDGNEIIGGYTDIEPFGQSTYVCYERRWQNDATDAYVIMNENKQVLHREAAGPNDPVG